MKVRIHKKKRLVAFYFKSIEMWEIYQITTRGTVSKVITPYFSFNKSFTEALRELKNFVPLSGWNSKNLDTTKMIDHIKAAEQCWKKWK